MHLRHRRGSERLLFDFGERLPPRMPKRVLNDFHDGFERNRRHIGTQRLEGIGVRFRDDVAAVRCDLPHLHERRAEILENGRSLLRREARVGLMGAQNRLYLAHALARRLVVESDLHRLHDFAERGHGTSPPYGLNRPILP